MARIFGRVKLAGGAPYTGAMLFDALDTPLLEGTTLVIKSTVSATADEEGNFAVDLLWGHYRVRMGIGRSFYILAPADPNSHNLRDVLVWSLPVGTTEPEIPDPLHYPMATSTTAGIVKTSSDSTDPVVLLVDDAETTYIAQNPSTGAWRVSPDGKSLQLPVYHDGTFTGKWRGIIGLDTSFVGGPQLMYGEEEA